MDTFIGTAPPSLWIASATVLSLMFLYATFRWSRLMSQYSRLVDAYVRRTEQSTKTLNLLKTGSMVCLTCAQYSTLHEHQDDPDGPSSPGLRLINQHEFEPSWTVTMGNLRSMIDQETLVNQNIEETLFPT